MGCYHIDAGRARTRAVESRRPQRKRGRDLRRQLRGAASLSRRGRVASDRAAATRRTALDAGFSEHAALATLTDHDTTVSLEFRFNQAGEVTGIHTPARWGSFAGAYRQLAWERHFGNYVERDGMRVPAEGEVGWYVAGTWRRVWKGTVTWATYEFAR